MQQRDWSEKLLVAVLQPAVLPGSGRCTWGRELSRTWPPPPRETNLGKARSLGELGAHVSLIHANQGSVQLLSSLQVSFQQRTLAEFVVGNSEAESPPHTCTPRPFLIEFSLKPHLDKAPRDIHLLIEFHAPVDSSPH